MMLTPTNKGFVAGAQKCFKSEFDCMMIEIIGWLSYRFLIGVRMDLVVQQISSIFILASEIEMLCRQSVSGSLRFNFFTFRLRHIETQVFADS